MSERIELVLDPDAVHQGGKKVALIKLIRTFSGASLKEAKEISETGGSTILTKSPYSEVSVQETINDFKEIPGVLNVTSPDASIRQKVYHSVKDLIHDALEIGDVDTAKDLMNILDRYAKYYWGTTT